MKKVGILTFHYSKYNFGAVLQAYSIQKLVALEGFDSYLIDFKSPYGSLKSKVWDVIMDVLGANFNEFREEYLPNILEETNDEKKLRGLNKFLDGFIVGSDQVWRYVDKTENLYRYYFDFVDDEKPKIAYAASFGVDYWPDDKEEVTRSVKKLAQRFDAVSVREESGVLLCEKYFNIDDVISVLDPTMLLDKKYFDEIANPKKLLNKSYVAYMMLHNYKKNENFFKEICKKRDLKFLRMQGPMFYSSKMFYKYRKVSDWLAYIRDAEIVITDSFHTVVFSVLYKKNFLVISNPITGITRLKNLLEMIGHGNKFYDSIDDIVNIDKVFKQPDFDLINKVLNKEKEKSFRFLKKSLDLIK